MDSLKLLLATILLVLAGLASQACNKPEQIIIDTTDIIKQHIDTASQELTAIVDDITHTGRMSIFQTLRASRKSKKKIRNTIHQVELELNKANNKIEEKTGKKQPIIRKRTDDLLAESTQEILKTHKKIRANMMQALKRKKQATVVLQAAQKSKHKIEKFQQKLTFKIKNICKDLKSQLNNSNSQTT